MEADTPPAMGTSIIVSRWPIERTRCLVKLPMHRRRERRTRLTTKPTTRTIADTAADTTAAIATITMKQTPRQPMLTSPTSILCHRSESIRAKWCVSMSITIKMRRNEQHMTACAQSAPATQRSAYFSESENNSQSSDAFKIQVVSFFENTHLKFRTYDPNRCVARLIIGAVRMNSSGRCTPISPTIFGHAKAIFRSAFSLRPA